MEYIVHLIILIGIYGILGLSLNLIVGYTGLLSVTQAAFYGIGAYATAILMISLGLNFFLALGQAKVSFSFVSPVAQSSLNEPTKACALMDLLFLKNQTA
jgi:branched-chain amino acid transport system permease protein